MAPGRKKFYEYEFVLVGFSDGLLLVQGGWTGINEDGLPYSAFPPFASEMTGLQYDKHIQKQPIIPGDDWEVHPVSIRAYSDDFSKVRLKIKTAEECSDTDLNSCSEGLTERRRARTRKTVRDSEDEDLPSLSHKVKIRVPAPPVPAPPVPSNSAARWKNRSELRGKPHQVQKTSERVKSNNQPTSSSSSCQTQPGTLVKIKSSLKIENQNNQSEPVRRTSSPLQTKSIVKCDLNEVSNGSSKSVARELFSTPSEDLLKDGFVEQLKLLSATSSQVFQQVQLKGQIAASPARQTSCHLEPSDENPGNKNGDWTTPKSSEVEHQSKDEGSEMKKSGGKTAKEHAMALAVKMNETEFRAYVILNINEMRSQLKEFTVKGRSASKRSVSNAGNDIEDDVQNALEGLPADSKEAWEEFDKKLRADKKYSLEVAMEIKDQCYGMTDIRDYVRHAMTLVITNACASEYSYCGRLEKAPFRGMYFVKLLQWILVKHTAFPKKKGEVKSIISDWLRLAEQRFGGRKFTSRKKKRSVELPSESGQGKSSTSTPVKDVQKPRPSKKKNIDDSDDVINLDESGSFSVMLSPIKKVKRRAQQFVTESFSETVSPLKTAQRRRSQQIESETSRDEAEAEEGDFADL